MSHLVTPRGFRAGKTHNWLHNVLSNNKISAGNLTNTYGIEKVCRRLLKKKRLYLVSTNTALATSKKNKYRILFIPRIKIRPNTRVTGNFGKKIVYKMVDPSANMRALIKFKKFKNLKVAKLRSVKNPERLNKWLSKRLFRGSSRLIRIAKTTIPDVHRVMNNFYKKIKLCSRRAGNIYYKQLKNSRWNTIKSGYCNFIKKRHKWKFSKISLKRFNSRKFSIIISKILNRPTKISCMNIFLYFFKKQILNYKSHQNHFWNFRYRKYRFQFKNYYDIINSFLFMGILNNAEIFFLSVIKITLPLILKFKKFFRFLTLAIKYMPQIENKFTVFRLFIAGKLAGGTKRTKFNKIGYGVLAVQSLSESATSNFTSFMHVYGSFGVGLLMVRNAHHSPHLNF